MLLGYVLEKTAMDIRTMKYFIAVAQAGSITRAAQELHISQPALSRQMIELERELGCKLLDRSGRAAALTADGRLFLNRSKEIAGLFDKTTEEFRSGTAIGGDIHIGCSETQAMQTVADAVARLSSTHPDVRVHLHSEDSDDVTEHLKHGLYDFGVMVGPARTESFHTLRLPRPDTWGVMVRDDDSLAQLERVRPEDLVETTLIVPEKEIAQHRLADWFGAMRPDLSAVATCNLLFNGSLLVRAGVGAVLCLGDIVSAHEGSGLAFVPLDPPLTSYVDLVWSRAHELSPAGRALLESVSALAEQEWSGAAQAADSVPTR